MNNCFGRVFMSKLNILSLFNGFGGAFLALEKANVRVEKLYVSEVDKHAIKCADAINPNNINLGDVCNIDVNKLDKIDMIVGGSPCQSFSFAGKRKGMSTTDNIKITTLEQYLELKENNFEFEGQSFLFWEYMRILKDIQKYNPDVIFFLENVVMTKDWEYILSEAIGIKSVMINSSRVSAQNRKRLYWSNIKTTTEGFFSEVVQDIEQPEDLGILLKDVLEDEVDEKYYLSDEIIGKFTPNYFQKEGSFETRNRFYFENNKHGALQAEGIRETGILKVDKQLNPKANQEKASCLTAGGHSGGNHSDMDLIVKCVAMRGRNTENPKSRESGLDTVQMIEPRADNKTNTLTTVQKDNMVMESLIVPEATEKGYTTIEPGECVDLENINSKTRRGRKMDSKSNTLMASTTQFHKYEGNTRIRRLTPRECFRLQTVAENHIDTLLNCGVSNSQLYKCCGNGWTIDVIAHFFKEI